jgi:hypothetical protein
MLVLAGPPPALQEFEARMLAASAPSYLAERAPMQKKQRLGKSN